MPRMKKIILLLVLLTFTASLTFAAETATQEAGKRYDGVWFMGFNLKQDIFKGKSGLLLRQAIATSIDKKYIPYKVMGDSVVPTGAIPPGMSGYDEKLAGYPYDIPAAKKLLKAAGYSPSDRRIKQFTFGHTDGKKTIEIAKVIENQLTQIGIKVARQQITYDEAQLWEQALVEGKFQMFLMGYKATNPEDTVTLLSPLFAKDGAANMTFYRNPQVNTLLEQVAETPIATEREIRLKEINQAILLDCPTVNLFYITVL